MNMLVRITGEEDGTIRPLADRVRKMPGWQRGGLVLLPLLVIGGGSIWALDHSRPAQAAPPPTPVTFARPIERDVTEWDDYVGRFAPSQTVEVRPRVSGAITAIHFKDGDLVKRGQLLMTIDQRPFLAALAEAQAGVSSARSALTLARSDLARATRLTGDDAVSGGEIDSLRSRAQSAEAALTGAEARLRARALDVDFTQVRAPISGRVSDRRIDIGNLVAGGEGAAATLLTTINALDPIYFSFDASEALFLKTQRERKAGAEAPEVEIRLQDESDYKWKGKIDFTDNGLDPRSGTIRGRATLANPGLFLTPGMFGNMRLASSGKVRALLVPDEAVQTDQVRKTVLVVSPDSTVAAKPVEIGPTIGTLRIIRSGLSPSDKVVIAGMQSAMPGSKVQAQAGRFPIDSVTGGVATPAPIASQATFSTR